MSDAIRVLRSLRADGRVPLATVSGIASTNAAMIDWFARSTPIALLTSKSIQPHPNPGNREPVIVEPQPGDFGNAVGLRNAGMEATAREFERLLPARAEWRPDLLLAVSLAANDEAGFEELAARLAPHADLLELNLSCPHAHGGYGSAIGSDPALVASCVRAAIRGAERAVAVGGQADGPRQGNRGAGLAPVPVIAKLTPNVDRIGAIARAAVDAGAAGVSAINTVGPDQYREPHSGAVLLTNPPDGRGGRSGRWVRERALECVAECREAIGAKPLLVGMGGVESRADAAAMVAAGADVVGVGSVLARVPQREWGRFLAWIGTSDPPAGQATPMGRGVATLNRTKPVPSVRPAPDARMRYQPARVTARTERGGGMFELETDIVFEYRAGQTAFVWLPEVGEKPFSPACGAPLRVLVRNRGPFTAALACLRPGDTLYVRGPYGEGADLAALAQRRVIVAAAGSGTAVVPALLDALDGVGAAVELVVAIRDRATAPPLEDLIAPRVAVEYVYDDGVTGRALERLGTLDADDGLCAIGPEPFMERAVEIARERGVAMERCMLSLERTMLCGVGLCGACHCDGELTCQGGTFVTGDHFLRGMRWTT